MVSCILSMGSCPATVKIGSFILKWLSVFLMYCDFSFDGYIFNVGTCVYFQDADENMTHRECSKAVLPKSMQH